jgi:peroxiredoxin Q/BCP
MRLTPGDPAPQFDLLDHDGNPVSLSDYQGRKLVVYFYPKAFTPGCTVESCDFRDSHESFLSAGYDIVGVSPDPVDRLDGFRNKHELPFKLLSDEDHAAAEAYGAWGLKKNYGREYEGIIRSTIVVASDGKVEQARYNVRAKGHVARIADALSVT